LPSTYATVSLKKGLVVTGETQIAAELTDKQAASTKDC
jgi:hypothetical protein